MSVCLCRIYHVLCTINNSSLHCSAFKTGTLSSMHDVLQPIQLLLLFLLEFIIILAETKLSTMWFLRQIII